MRYTRLPRHIHTHAPHTHTYTKSMRDVRSVVTAQGMDSLLFQRKMWIATHGPNMYVSLRAYMQASESMDGQPMVAAEIIQRSKLKEAEGSAPILSVEKMRHPFLSGAAGGEYACVRRDACQCACACVTARVCACVCVDVCVVPVCPG